jgi:hypothetical protein
MSITLELSTPPSPYDGDTSPSMTVGRRLEQLV